MRGKLRNSVRLAGLIMRAELRAVATSHPTLLVMLGGVVLYGLLYNLLYEPNVIREAPIVVFDESQSPLSRRLLELIDASPSAEIVGEVASPSEGRRTIAEGKAQALIVVPADFAERLGRGEQGIIAILSSTDSFLYYEATAGTTMDGLLALGEEYRGQMMWALPREVVVQLAQSGRIEIVGTALFNPSRGYADYLIPIVLIIIIFQTMTMAIAMTSAERRERGQTPLRGLADSLGARLIVIASRSLFYTLTYGALAIFLIGLLPRIFGLPHLASPATLATFMTPFLVATSLFGQSFARLFADRDAPILLITFFSVGLIFIAGVSFPLEQIPPLWRALHYLFPASVGSVGFVAIEAMGASLGEVAAEWWTLIGQSGLYLTLAIVGPRGWR